MLQKCALRVDSMPTTHRKIREEVHHLASSEPFPQYSAVFRIDSVDLEDVLRDIESDRGYLHGLCTLARLRYQTAICAAR